MSSISNFALFIFRFSVWGIEMLEGERIKLTFLDFDLENHYSCGYDYLEVSVT